MEALKLVGVGVIISVVAILVKSIKPELSIGVTIAGSIIMLLFVLDYFTDIFNVFLNIVNKTGIDSELFYIVIKIIGIGYIVEFGANMCIDSGNSGIADKLLLGGKVLIFIMAMPIITSLFDLIVELIPWKNCCV